MIDLNEIATEIRDILDKRREELKLTFIEDTHTYYMKDLDGGPISAGIVWRDSPVVDSIALYPTFLSKMVSIFTLLLAFLIH